MFYRYEHYMSISHMALIVTMEQYHLIVFGGFLILFFLVGIVCLCIVWAQYLFFLKGLSLVELL